MKPASMVLDVKQRDYPGGIQMWGSNSAILWTAAQSEDEGIHIHAFSADAQILIDDTFASVCIDGVDFDPTAVRICMAQGALPHISGRVVSIRCPQCLEAHFDLGSNAFTPHDRHVCTRCGLEFPSRGRLRKTIANPAIELLHFIRADAVREPQRHDARLLPETL